MAKKQISFDLNRLFVLQKARDQKRAIVRDLSTKNTELQEQKLEVARQIRSSESRIAMNGRGLSSDIIDAREAEKQERHAQNVRQTEIAHLLSETQKEMAAANAQFGAASQLFVTCLKFVRQSGMQVPFLLRGESDA